MRPSGASEWKVIAAILSALILPAQVEAPVAPPNGFALMGNAEEVSRIASGQESRDFLTTRDVGKYIEYFKSQGWYVGEHNQFYLAIEQESMLIYGAVIQSEILKLVAEAKDMALPTEQLSMTQRRYLMGVLSGTGVPIDALKYNDGAVMLNPTLHLTLADGNGFSTVTYAPVLFNFPPMKVERPDRALFEQDEFIPPRRWDYRFYDVLINANARRSHDSYMEVLTTYKSEMDEKMQLAMGDIARLMMPRINESFIMLEINPSEFRFGRQLPETLQYYMLRNSSGDRNNPLLTAEYRRHLIENGALQALSITFLISVARKGESHAWKPVNGVEVTVNLGD